ncbi:cytoplasmic dynein 1 heavy chain 1-like [Saccoglossus kowalevskii]|uniref:Cytoplasmic dynein 1 heavy chain 1-like n=1 Tax=Saccoglossus kowalevskii TaxID=10224 RepID=A0ABM0GJ63_SACKO|nr:PREDICTED: cytoplasmic dynein 1 heavy chain 1-like [Saccoglossus kowalevskii]
MKRSADNIKDPLFRFFEREVNLGAKLLEDVRQDLNEVIQVCDTKKKQTNYHRALIGDLVKGILPKSWNLYTVPTGITVIQWISDFSERIKQLQKLSTATVSGGAKELKNQHVWLGGLFKPDAYVTATRQYVAQANNWSLEELSMKVSVSDDGKQVSLDDCSFSIIGLRLQGATCSGNLLHLSNLISTELPFTSFTWTRLLGDMKVKACEGKITLPVYLNHTRSELLFTVDLAPATDVKADTFCERGVALLCSGAFQ